MTHRTDMTWPEAREIARQGIPVRRRHSDRQIIITQGGLAWIRGEEFEVVAAEDFGRAEFLAADWTTLGWDQQDCLPVTRSTEIVVDEIATVIFRRIVNPYAAAARVTITGTATDHLQVDSIVVPIPASFSLPPSGGFDLHVTTGPGTALARADLTITIAA